jgi:hypothetical protein
VNSTLIGLYYAGTGNGAHLISQNLIHSLGNTSNGNASVIGFWNNASNVNFYNNAIRIGLDSNGNGNNAQLDLRGFVHNTNVSANVYHNSIYVGGTNTFGATTTAALNVGFTMSVGQTLNIRNNILYNAASNTGSATSKHYAMRFDGGVLRVNSNNNIFGTPGAGGVLANAGPDYATLRGAGGWNQITALDYNSGILTSSPFINATGNAQNVDLHLAASNAAEGMGDVAISDLVNLDFDGQTRSSFSAADIGADAGSFILTPDIFAPSISFATLGNTGDNVGPRTLSNVTITDAVGVS